MKELLGRINKWWTLVAARFWVRNNRMGQVVSQLVKLEKNMEIRYVKAGTKVKFVDFGSGIPFILGEDTILIGHKNNWKYIESENPTIDCLEGKGKEVVI